MAPGVSVVCLCAEAASPTRGDQLAHTSSAEKKLIDTIQESRTPSVRERVLVQLTWIAQLARDADLARQKPGLKMAANGREEYDEEAW